MLAEEVQELKSPKMEDHGNGKVVVRGSWRLHAPRAEFQAIQSRPELEMINDKQGYLLDSTTSDILRFEQ